MYMGKTFRGNDHHDNFRKYKNGKMKGKRKDKFVLPDTIRSKDKADWKRQDTSSYQYDDTPNYYDDNVR